VKSGIDLLVFCGGDGTARDILHAVQMKVPVIGVPTGVKMHSAVFAINPKSAARIGMKFLWGFSSLHEAEVMDIDEESYRKGRISARLMGYLLTPYEPDLLQGIKRASPITDSELRSQVAMALFIIETMEPDVTYILGPGTTTRTIADILHINKTLLGVDLLRNKRLIAKDVNENEILRTIQGNKAKIIVTPIGGQGFIFGRGNQQISPKVIRYVGKNNILVVSTESKLRGLGSLRVDTGDQQLDASFHGVIPVITDYRIQRIIQIKNPTK
jgi:predicted polyphosphate/ATP-dependent NAD kinase